MSMAKSNLMFSGLFISLEQKHAIELLFAAFQNKSPSDSSVSLQVVSGECDVNCFLRIKSKVMNFEVSKKGTDPLTVVKLLSKLWQKEISNWHKERVI